MCPSNLSHHDEQGHDEFISPDLRELKQLKLGTLNRWTH